MKDFKTIPIPDLMKNCELDPRGLPVPYVVLKDQNGKHHFKVNDQKKTINCIIGELCTICGTKMSRNNQWLVGGIASAFDPSGYYFDHPVHKECAEYALQVCPYLAYRNYTAKTDIVKLQKQIKDTVLLDDPTMDSDRLPLFVLIRPEEINLYGSINNIKVVPSRPALETEFWDNGERITDMEIVKSKLINTKWEKYLEIMLK